MGRMTKFTTRLMMSTASPQLAVLPYPHTSAACIQYSSGAINNVYKKSSTIRSA